MSSTRSRVRTGDSGATPAGTRPKRTATRGEREFLPNDAPAAFMAEQLCRGFRHHDRRDRSACTAAFFEVDRRQFDHLDDGAAHDAAEAYADALWAKDSVEAPYVSGPTVVDPAKLDAADWSPVRDALVRRASVVGMDRSYADQTTKAWRVHKTGGDYWTPTLRAQARELRAAFRDPGYPEKEGAGASGFGPLAARYLVGVELHDMHTERCWEEAIEVMTPYFAEILDHRREDR